MEYIKRNYDRVFMVVAAVLALLLGGLLALKAMALRSSFERETPVEKSELGESGVGAIAKAEKHLAADFAWQSPTMPGVPQKPLPLFVPVPIYVQNGDEIDLLNPQSKKMRDPIDNSYLFKYSLPGGRSDLNELDLDNDGFTTEEEFSDGKTDPTDPKSHPALASKLFVAEIKSDIYRLSYRTGDREGGDFGIREETELFPTDPPREVQKRKTHFVRKDVAFGVHLGNEDRYTITAFEQKEEPGRIPGDKKKVGIITVADAKGEPFKIREKEEHVVYTRYAVFHYALPQVNGLLEGAYKKGDVFELPGAPGVKYEVLDVPADASEGVKIRMLAGPDGTPKDLEIRPLEKK